MTWGRQMFVVAVAAALAGCMVEDTSSSAWCVPIPPASAQDVRVTENPCATCRGREASVEVKVAYDVVKRAAKTPGGDSAAELLDSATRRNAEKKVQDLKTELGRIPGLRLVDGPADYSVTLTIMLARGGLGMPVPHPAGTAKRDNIVWSHVKVHDSAGKQVALSVEGLERLSAVPAYVCEVRDNGAFVRVPVRGTRFRDAHLSQMVGFRAHVHAADAVRETHLGYGLVVAKEEDSVWIQVFNPDEARIPAGAWVSP